MLQITSQVSQQCNTGKCSSHHYWSLWNTNHIFLWVVGGPGAVTPWPCVNLGLISRLLVWDSYRLGSFSFSYQVDCVKPLKYRVSRLCNEYSNIRLPRQADHCLCIWVVKHDSFSLLYLLLAQHVVCNRYNDSNNLHNTYENTGWVNKICLFLNASIKFSSSYSTHNEQFVMLRKNIMLYAYTIFSVRHANISMHK